MSTFYRPRRGLVKARDVRYEYSGDRELWVRCDICHLSGPWQRFGMVGDVEHKMDVCNPSCGTLANDLLVDKDEELPF